MADVEEAKVVEEPEGQNDEAPQSGVVSVEITDSNVRYDTNLSAPELVFWLKIVQQMVIDKIMDGESA